jgi:hypothetical protein
MTFDVFVGFIVLGLLIFILFSRINEKKDEKFDKRKW